MGDRERRRVVVTGMGTINPLGSSLEEFHSNMLQGKSGVKKWTSLDLTVSDCKVGGDLGDFDFKAALASLKDKIPDWQWNKLKKLFRTCTFSNRVSTLAAVLALNDSKLHDGSFDPFSTSVVVAGHDLNHGYILANNLRFLEEPSSIDFLAGTEAMDTNVAATISELTGCKGATCTVGGACASGNLALRSGYRDIISGEYERAMVCGALFDITGSDIYSMTLLNAVVTDPALQENPERASRPFDVRRGGFVPSHGAGALVLEELEVAKKRGAQIYGEIVGVKACSDGNRLPSPNSAGQARLIGELLKSSGVRPEDVDYVNCHATSTKAGDVEEVEAIKQAFGKHAYNLKLNAPKSMLGHLTWSAAVVEVIAGLLQMKHGVLYPSINVDELDPQIDLDVCANEAKPHQIKCFLKNAFGFGGLNCCALIKRYED